MEANNEDYMNSIVSFINLPSEDAPRVPSTLINIEEESVPMLSLARTDSDTDLDAFNGPPQQAAPAPPPVTVTPRITTQQHNIYENTTRVPAPRKKDAVSNSGYTAVYDKN